MAKTPPATTPGPLPKPKSPYAPIGTAGLRQAGGYVSADFRPELVGANGRRLFAEMGENDPVLSGILFATSMLLRKVPWTVQPADEKNKEAQTARELVEDELFEEMQTPWADMLSEVCTMFTFGFAPMEIIWRKRPDGELGVLRLALRSQETLWKWEFSADTVELLGMWQQDVWAGKAAVFIPLNRLVLFRTQRVYENPEGRSLLRGCYVPWVRKKAIEEAEGRAALRAAGVVKLRVPGDIMQPDASAADKATYAEYRAVAERLAQDRQGAIILPHDVEPETNVEKYDFEYVLADSPRAANMTDIVERIDKRLAATVLADWILLGQQSLGSFALSSDKTDIFYDTLEGWLGLMADTLNRQLIRPWWALRGLDETTRPKLVPGDVRRVSLPDLGTFIANVSRAGMPLFPDERLEKHLRGVAKLPEPSPETQERSALEHEQAMNTLQGLDEHGQPKPSPVDEAIEIARAKASIGQGGKPGGGPNGKKE